MYEASRTNAIFFVIFIVTCTFYLHSLTLSLVFQVFIRAATEVHHRSAVDKEDSIRYAFLALSLKRTVKQSIGQVHIDMIRETMQKVRSNYGTLKVRDVECVRGRHGFIYCIFRFQAFLTHEITMGLDSYCFYR